MADNPEYEYLPADPLAETVSTVSLAYGWRELARAHYRLTLFHPLATDDGAAGEPASALPPDHPGLAFARWRGWLRGK